MKEPSLPPGCIYPNCGCLDGFCQAPGAAGVSAARPALLDCGICGTKPGPGDLCFCPKCGAVLVTQEEADAHADGVVVDRALNTTPVANQKPANLIDNADGVGTLARCTHHPSKCPHWEDCRARQECVGAPGVPAVAPAGPVVGPSGSDWVLVGYFMEDGGRWLKMDSIYADDPDAVGLYRKRYAGVNAPDGAQQK